MAQSDDTPGTMDDGRATEEHDDSATAEAVGIGGQSAQPDPVREPPASEMELLRELDAFLEDIDRDAPTIRARTTPDDHYRVADRLGRDTRSQSLVGVDYVRDDGIAVADDAYIGLLEITSRNWLSLDDEERRTVMSAYMSFLMSLRSPIVIACYPQEFDLTAHLQQFADVGRSRETYGESPILQYGRKYYIDWASRRVDEQNIKRRAFYVVTRVDAGHVHANLDSGSALSRLPVVGDGLARLVGALPGLGRGPSERAREQLCVREVRKRQKRIASNLGRTGVGLEIVRDRQRTMEVLYHYYNHVDPLFEEFNHATRTQADNAPDAATNEGAK